MSLAVAGPAGRTVTADLDFTLTLPDRGLERYGHTARTAWWASGFPLLAWERGHGWAREPAAPFLSETATSETAAYDVTVDAPAADTVLGNGVMDPPVRRNALRRWHFRNDRARDVGVAVGDFAVARKALAGVPVTIGAASDLDAAVTPRLMLGPLTVAVESALRTEQRLFGPYAFDGLTVVALPRIGRAGIEYPGMVYVGSQRYDAVVPHEVAHQWFYGLVGNDQARDPWLDEAFATYAQALVTGQDFGSPTGGDVGAPVASYPPTGQQEYAATVYGQGAAALLRARAVATPAVFDRALRCYVRANAYRIATPADVAAALPATEVLREAGAIR